FFFSSRRRHTRSDRDWSSDVCSSDLVGKAQHVHVVYGANVAPAWSNRTRRIHRSKLLVNHRKRAVSTRGICFSHPCTRRSELSRSEERRVGKECRSGWLQYN